MSVVPGIVLGGAAVPTDSADTYPVTDPQWGLGGCRTVTTTSDRNAIPVPRLQRGMLVHCTTTGITYRLKDTWPGGILSVDADWEVAISAGGALIGGGIPDSVAYWFDANTIIADAFFKYPPATEVLQTKQGLNFYAYNVATTRYIDPLGSDSNDGLTALTPWKTIQYAMQQCLIGAPGNYRIVCAAGTYANASFDVPDFVGRSYDSSAYGSLIEIIGDETTPSNVIFKNTLGIVYQASQSTKLRIAGVRFHGNGTSTTIIQTAGELYLRNIEADNFYAFASSSYNSKIFTELGSNGIVITNTYKGFISTKSLIVNASKVSLSAHDDLIPCDMWTLYGSTLINGTGCDFAQTGIIITGVGYYIVAVNSYVDLGSLNTYNQTQVSGFFDIDGLTYVKGGFNNTIVSVAPLCIGRASGKSFYDDTGSNVWNFSPLPADLIVLKSDGQFRSANILRSGILILNDLIDYIQIAADDNYTRYALDGRYTEKYGFTTYGEQPQGVTSNCLYPGGYASDPYYIYKATAKAVITSLSVSNRVAPGVLLADTYYVYVNGAVSSLSANLTTGTSVTVSGSVNLVAGDVVDLRVTTSAFSLAQDITVQIEVKILGA